MKMNCQDHYYRNADPRQVARRWFLERCGIGLGGMALADLAGVREAAAASHASHHPTRAKNVIFLFMAGGPSQVDLFDNKPELTRHDGTPPPPSLVEGYRAAFINKNSKLLGPKFRFRRFGQSGVELSELLPHLGSIVDDITIIRSMQTDAFNHAPGQLLMSTGSQQFGKPSFGAWTLYGLGSESRDLPGFVVFSTGKKGPSGGAANWGSGFLPTVHQGVPLRTEGDPVLYLSNPPGVDRRLQADTVTAVNEINRHQLNQIGDPEIATRINAYEMAFRMQATAPNALDLGDEPQHILDMYGAERGRASFGTTCLMARRLVERGVRFVEIFHEAWDQHGNLVKDLQLNCQRTDQAAAALVKDLKQRGLLDDTLVIWGGEFGRTPMVEGGDGDGRDHHPNAFTMWIAGGGVRQGYVHGQTDDLGFNVASDPVHVRDLHATLLNLLGLDHNRLTYKFQGLDQRLTGVEPARIVEEVLA